MGQMVTAWFFTSTRLYSCNPFNQKNCGKPIRDFATNCCSISQGQEGSSCRGETPAIAAKAKAFNYRLEQILSAHGGAAAVVVGSGARAAVRGWDSHGQDPESHTEQTDIYGDSRPGEESLHWSGEKRRMSGLRMSRLPKENLRRLAGRHTRIHVHH